MRLDVKAIKDVSQQLAQQLKSIGNADDLDSLRGIEGEASARYYSVFNQLILNQKILYKYIQLND